MDDPLDFGHRHCLWGGDWPANCAGAHAAHSGYRSAAGGLYQPRPRDAAGHAGAVPVSFSADRRD